MCFLLGYSNVQAQNCSLNAGINKTICPGQPFVLKGRATGQIGTPPVWSQVSGPAATLGNTVPAGAGDYNAVVTNFIANATYVFRLSGQCSDGSYSYQDVTYVVSSLTPANAGVDEVVCPGVFNLKGSPLAPGDRGEWIKILGDEEMPDPENEDSPSASLTIPQSEKGLTATYRWIVTRGGCTSFDDVVITNLGTQPIDAGANQNVGCYNVKAGTRLAGSFAASHSSGQLGTWTMISGPTVPVFTDENLHNTWVSNLIEGTYVLRWTVKGQCQNGFDDVTINVLKPSQDVTNAGHGLDIYCDGRTSFVLKGPQASYANEVVSWTQITGPTAVINNANSNVTTVSVPIATVNTKYDFIYSITNPITGCVSEGAYSVQFNAAPAVIITTPAPYILLCGKSSAVINYATVGGTSTQYALVQAPTNSTIVTSFGGLSNFITAKASGKTIPGFDKVGTYILRYRQNTENTAGGCTDAYADIKIIVSADAEESNAGTKQILACNVLNATLAGNTPDQGVGKWSQVSGPNKANIVNPIDPGTAIVGLNNGVYVFRWIITNGEGGCVNSQSDVEVVVSNGDPTASVAGESQTTCYGTPVTLTANSPLAQETGTWTVFRGSSPALEVKFSDIHDPNANVTGLNPNTVYTFTWTIKNGCNVSTSSSVNITTTLTAGPKQAIAGPDQCFPNPVTFTLAANAPDHGEIGVWKLVNGPNNPTFTNDYNTSVTDVVAGVYEFEWSLSNGSCSATTSIVKVVISDPVTTAVAGPNQNVCGTETILAANIPIIGIGKWVQTEGAGGVIITDPLLANTTISGLTAGRYKFTWTITNDGSCSTSSVSELTINVSASSSIADAGLDITVCDGNTATLAAAPVTNGTGRWVTVSGPSIPVYADVTKPNTTVSGLIYGKYELQWISSGGLYCPETTDNIFITVTQKAYAGANQLLCNTNTISLLGNLNSVGVWSLISGQQGVNIDNDATNGAIVTGLTSDTYTFRYTIAAVPGCPESSAEVTYTISAAASIANAGADQSLCLPNGQTTSTFTLVGNAATTGTGKWTVLEMPADSSPVLANASSGTTDFTANMPGIYLLKWEISNIDCTGSTGSNDLMKISIFTAANAGPDQLGLNCVDNITLSANQPLTGTGKWTLLPGAPNTPVITNVNAPETTVTGIITGTYTFRWTFENEECGISQDDVQVVVSSTPPNIAKAGDDKTICIAAGSSFALNGNQPTGAETGLWEIISPNPTSATLANATSYNTSLDNLTAGVYTLRWSLRNGICASQDELILTVLAAPTTANIITPSPVLTCLYQSVILSADPVTSGVGTWSVTAIPVGAPSPIFDQVNGTTTGVFGLIEGTYEFIFTTSNGSCNPSISAPVVVVISKPGTPSAAGTSRTTCLGTTIQLGANVPDAGTGIGTWVVTVQPGGANVTIDNINDAHSNFTADQVGNYILTWTINNGGCTSVSSTQVIVTPQLADNTISSLVADVCRDGKALITGATPKGGTGIYSYLWQQSTNGVDFTIISGANGIDYTAAPVNNQDNGDITYTYRRIVLSGNCAESVSNPVSVVIPATIKGNVLTTPVSNFCFIGDPSIITGTTTHTGGNGTYTYQWQQSINSTTSYVDIPGATTASYDPPLLPENTGTGKMTYRYKRLVKSGDCFIESVVIITINPKPALSSVSLANICSNTVFNYTPTSGVAGTTFTWTRASVNGVSNSAATGAGNISETLINTSNTAKNVVYVFTLAANGCVNPTTFTLTVTVNPSPIGTNDIVAVDCGGVLSYNLKANIDKAIVIPSTFRWTVIDNGNVSGESNGTGEIINQTLINHTSTVQQVVYTIVPTSTEVGACPGKPFTLTVTVPVCPGMTITKTTSFVGDVTKAGDVIPYEIVVTNTGNADQTNVVVKDPFLSASALVPSSKTDDNPDNVLNKGETWIYTGTYTVTQADLDNNGKPALNSGQITNTATVVSTELPGPKTAETTVKIVAVSSYTIAKTSTTTQITTAGQIVPYDIEVKNTGNTAISNVIVNDPMLTNITLFSGDGNSNNKLDMGETWIFKGSHIVTQAELDANGNTTPADGKLHNIVSVNGDKPDGNPVYPTPVTDEVLIPIQAAGSFEIKKNTTTPIINKVDQIIPYTITVANTGKVAITDVVVVDPLLNGLLPITSIYSGDVNSNGILDVNETWTYTGSYTVTQADMDNNGYPINSGTIVNTASVSGKLPGDIPITENSNIVVVPVKPYVAYTIVKTADKTEITAAGQIVNYTITVRNTGDAAIENLTVTDPMLVLSAPTGDANTDGKLNINEIWTYTGAYTVKQADLDNNGNNSAHIGTLSNTAIVKGDRPDRTSLDPAESIKLIPLNTSSEFTVVKTANTNEVTAAGQVVTYTITVKNTGTTAVNNVVLTDPMLTGTITRPTGDAGIPDVLDVNETWIYTGTYVVEQSDINNQGNYCSDGKLTNSANVTGKKPDGSSAGSVTSIVELPINPVASFSLTKTSDVTEVVKAGDLIKYTVTAENTGAVAINSFIVTDPMINLMYDNGDLNTDGKLDLTETWIYSGIYKVSQEDIDNNGNGTVGKLVNKVTANGRKPDGTLIPNMEATNEVDVISKAEIAVVKSSSISSVTKAGQEVPFTITVKNLGTVAVSNVEVTDAMLLSSPLLLTNGDANANGKLDVYETWTYAATYIVKQSDIDNFGNGITRGNLVNVATVSGESPNGPITPVSSTVTIPVQSIVAYSIEKVSTVADVVEAGQQIPYTILIRNTGNAAISDVLVNDPMLSASPLILSSGDENNNAKLDVAETWIYNGTYIVKQSDIDQNGNTSTKGVLSNTASVTGTAPDSKVLDPMFSTKVIPIRTSSSFTVDKSSDKAAVSKAGDVVNYTITITNTGKTAVSNVDVNDPLLGGVIAMSTSGDNNSNGILDIAEVWIYTGNYTVTQSDLNNNGNVLANGGVTANGNLVNIVTVTGNKPDGSSAGSVTGINRVPIDPAALFTLNKTSDVTEVTRAGDRVVYTVTAANTGDVAIHNFVVTDPMVSLAYLSGDLNADGKLDVTESWIYIGTYTVTQSDIDNQGNGITIGKLVNKVTANGRKPGGTLIPDVSTTHALDINAAPAMTVKKASATRLITRAGQVVTYAVTVANTGTIAISDVVVNDPMLSNIILYSGDVNGNGVMDVRETWTFTGTYMVTQADIDNFGMPTLNSGTLVNTASASGKLPNAAPINGTSNTVIIPIQVNAAYSIVKASTTTEITQAGQLVPYTITVKNTGGAAVSNVVINEPMMSVILISGDVNTNNKLDVNETWVYTGTYIVKQIDIDNNGNTTVKGVLSNTASLTGNKPDGAALTELNSTKVIPLNSSSLFTVTKTADKLLVGKAGEVINYLITVSNAGVTAISDVKVNDPLLGGIITAPSSGDANVNNILDIDEAWIYTGSYTVTQADIDRNGNALANNHAYANGNIINIVNVTGNKPDGKPAGSVTAVNEVPIDPTPMFSLTKTSDVIKVSKAGDIVVYTIVAENTGSVAINSFVAVDELINIRLTTGDTNGDGKLDVTESWTYTGAYRITQADIDDYGNGIIAGKLVNTVSASGRKPDGTVTSIVTATANVDIEPVSSMKIVKSSTTTVIDQAGQVVPYSITVANTGTVAINNVIVSDLMLNDLIYNNGDVNGNNKLDVNETWTYVGSYTVSQADIDNKGNTAVKGDLINIASVIGNNPDGSVSGPVTNTKTIPVAYKTDVTFSKIATTQVGNKAGETVTYELKVTNTGNTTLKDIVVTDDNAVISSGSPIVQLNPGQFVLVTAVHTLTQDEVDAGKVINQAKLSGVDPEGKPVTKDSNDPSTPTPDDPTITPIISPGSITLVKTAVLSSDGNTIEYSFIVKNAGIVTLSNVTISDTKITGPIVVSPSTLAPGAIGNARAVYTISAIEKTVGQVSNTAIVTGTSPNGFKVNDVSGTDENNNTPTLTMLPNITAVKSVSDANANGIIEAGEELTYTISIANDGEVDRTGVSINDPIPANTTFVNGSASNGGVFSTNIVSWNNLTIPANGSYSVNFKVKADAMLPNGLISIANRASVINPARPDLPIVAETNLPTEGKLESTKTVNDQKGNKDGLVQANEIITYAIEVKNIGGSTLTGIKISDVIPTGLIYIDGSASNGGNVTSGNTLTWLVDLAPDASVMLTFDAVAATDVNGITEIENVANILSPNGQVLEPSIKINVDPSADLVITKDLITPAPIQTGDRISYQIKVVNIGQNKATGVKVTDVLPGTLSAPFDIVVSKGNSNYTANDKTLGWTIGDLDLNETVTITFKSRVVATGSLVNTAKVSADQPDPVVDNNTASSLSSYVGGEELLIPNLFTPNGDGNNDTFEIIGLNQFADNDLVIVNRWGNEVFRTKMYQNNWTGEGLNEGTYYYVLRTKKTASAEWKVFKGYITLIRAFKN